MSGSYPKALRQRAIKFVVEEGGSRKVACRVLGIHRKTLENWLSMHERTGSICPSPRLSYWKRKVDIMLLQKMVEDRPDATLAELSAPFGVYPSTIDYHLRKLKITRKKNHAIRRTG